MKPLLEALGGARKIEIWLIIVLLCVLIVLCLGDSKSGETAADSDEYRLGRILSRIEGAGDVSVMLSQSEGELQGCVVAAEGAREVRVMLQLQRAVQAITGLELDRIEIVQSGRWG